MLPKLSFASANEPVEPKWGCSKGHAKLNPGCEDCDVAAMQKELSDGERINASPLLCGTPNRLGRMETRRMGGDLNLADARNFSKSSSSPSSEDSIPEESKPDALTLSPIHQKQLEARRKKREKLQKKLEKKQQKIEKKLAEHARLNDDWLTFLREIFEKAKGLKLDFAECGNLRQAIKLREKLKVVTDASNIKEQWQSLGTTEPAVKECNELLAEIRACESTLSVVFGLFPDPEPVIHTDIDGLTLDRRRRRVMERLLRYETHYSSGADGHPPKGPESLRQVNQF